jgi:predicted dehydrogenase
MASAEVAAQAFGAMEAYDDFHQLVRSNNVDIVTVCVRVPFHLDVVMAALEAGKHVMCEWPLGRDIGEAEKMAEAARTAGVRTCIGLQGRMALAAQRAREMLSRGAIVRLINRCVALPERIMRDRIKESSFCLRTLRATLASFRMASARSTLAQVPTTSSAASNCLATQTRSF